MREMGLEGNAGISVDLEKGYISLKLPEGSESHTANLEEIINEDPELKELLTFAASGIKMAKGGTDELVYDELNSYLKKYFGQDLSELGWENGKLTGANYMLESAFSCGNGKYHFSDFLQQNNIPNFWESKGTDLIEDVQFQSITDPLKIKYAKTCSKYLKGNETTNGFIATLSVLAKNGPPQSTGSIEFTLENGELKTVDPDHPLSKNQLTGDKKGDFEFFAKYSGTDIYRGYQYYEKIYDQIKK